MNRDDVRLKGADFFRGKMVCVTDLDGVVHIAYDSHEMKMGDMSSVHTRCGRGYYPSSSTKPWERTPDAVPTCKPCIRSHQHDVEVYGRRFTRSEAYWEDKEYSS